MALEENDPDKVLDLVNLTVDSEGDSWALLLSSILAPYHIRPRGW